MKKNLSVWEPPHDNVKLCVKELCERVVSDKVAWESCVCERVVVDSEEGRRRTAATDGIQNQKHEPWE